MEREISGWDSEAKCCTDPELVAQVRQLARADRKQAARLIVYLGEVDARRLYREEAYSSMITFTVGELGMSEAEAYLRILAARLGRQYPVIIQLLVTGTINLTTLKLLSPHLTAENHKQLLERASGKSKRQVELLVAEIDPKPDVRARLRKLPQPKQPSAAGSMAPTGAPSQPNQLLTQSDAAIQRNAAAEPNATHSTAAAPRIAVARSAAPPSVDVARSTAAARPIDFARASVDVPPVDVGGASVAALPAPRVFALEAPRRKVAACTPLRPERFELRLTGGKALRDHLEQLQHLLRHQNPSGDLAVIVERAVELLLATTLKQRFAQTAARKPADAQLARASTDIAAQRRSSADAITATGTGTEPATADVPAIANADVPATANADAPEIATADPPATAAAPAIAAADASATAENRRYVPRAVLREVYARDGGQCTFVAGNGRRCAERGMLEVHHVRAFALGGRATVGNLRLVCRAHNGLFAELDFGAEFVRNKSGSVASASVLTCVSSNS